MRLTNAETLAALRKWSDSGVLGYLGRWTSGHEKVYEYFQRRDCGRMNPDEIIEVFKTQRIDVCFSRYNSIIARVMARDSGSSPSNFTLFANLHNSGIWYQPSHFFWRGSWEGLAAEMKRDETILKQDLGFNIHSHGYFPELDCDFTAQQLKTAIGDEGFRHFKDFSSKLGKGNQNKRNRA